MGTVNYLSHGRDQLVLTKGHRSYWTRSASRLCWNEPARKDTSAHAACIPPPPRIRLTPQLTAETGSEWAGNVFKHFPVFTSHILTLSSNWRKEKQTLIVLFLSPAATGVFRRRFNICFPLERGADANTHRSWHDEIRLGVEVAAEDIVAVTLERFQAFALDQTHIGFVGNKVL